MHQTCVTDCACNVSVSDCHWLSVADAGKYHNRQLHLMTCNPPHLARVARAISSCRSSIVSDWYLLVQIGCRRAVYFSFRSVAIRHKHGVARQKEFNWRDCLHRCLCLRHITARSVGIFQFNLTLIWSCYKVVYYVCYIQEADIVALACARKLSTSQRLNEVGLTRITLDWVCSGKYQNKFTRPTTIRMSTNITSTATLHSTFARYWFVFISIDVLIYSATHLKGRF